MNPKENQTSNNLKDIILPITIIVVGIMIIASFIVLAYSSVLKSFYVDEVKKVKVNRHVLVNPDDILDDEKLKEDFKKNVMPKTSSTLFGDQVK